MELDIDAQVHVLEEKIRHASATDRLKMHPMVQKMVDGITGSGQKVPLKLSRMNADLADEAFDAMHDNMPL